MNIRNKTRGPRGVCRVCRREFALNTDGTVRRHELFAGVGFCDGGREAPIGRYATVPTITRDTAAEWLAGLPQLLRDERNARRVNQATACAQIGIHPSALSRIEAGQKGTDAVTIVAVLEWLGLAPWDAANGAYEAGRRDGYAAGYRDGRSKSTPAPEGIRARV